MLIHLCENCNPPERKSPLFPSNSSLNDEVLSSPPLFENLVGGSTPPLPAPPPTASRKEGGAYYVSAITKNVISVHSASKQKILGFGLQSAD